MRASHTRINILKGFTMSGHIRLSLPIDSYEGLFRQLLRDNRVVLVDAAPGVGKTLRCPEWSMSEGFRTLVTEPRRLAASNAARAVARELGEQPGQRVGFETSKERCRGRKTQLLFATDGLALEREFHGHQWRQVLIIDEVHEWSDRIELLVALSKRWLAQGQQFKLVIMSATMDVPGLSKFFWGAPVLMVPGVRNPIEHRNPGRSLEDDVALLIKEGRSVLAFQPGKREIQRTVTRLNQMGLTEARIFELHGDQKFEQQQEAFSYAGLKVVLSTPIAQASVTVPGIRAVIDTGLEKRIEIRNGVEALITAVISQADSTQRWGRSNRQEAGIVIDRCTVPFEQRRPFSVPEIERRRLDSPVLRLARLGFKPEEVEFFHQPTPRRVAAARATLRSFGCFTEADVVTAVGHQVAAMPLPVPFARMVLEAERQALPDAEREDLVEAVRTIAVLCEVGGVISREGGSGAVRAGETQSDCIAELLAFRAASGLNRDQMRSAGIDARQVTEVRDRLKDLWGARGAPPSASALNRELVIRCIVTGFVDRLYRRQSGGQYLGERPDDRREIGRESVVTGGEWLVALPLDIEADARRGAGKVTISLLRMVTTVTPELMTQAAPHLVRIESGLNPAYDADQGCVVSTRKIWFRGHLFKTENPGHLIREERVADPTHPDAPQVFAAWVAAQMT
jgi:ATP-dependent helicase HrpB